MRYLAVVVGAVGSVVLAASPAAGSSATTLAGPGRGTSIGYPYVNSFVISLAGTYAGGPTRVDYYCEDDTAWETVVSGYMTCDATSAIPNGVPSIGTAPSHFEGPVTYSVGSGDPVDHFEMPAFNGLTLACQGQWVPYTNRRDVGQAFGGACTIS